MFKIKGGPGLYFVVCVCVLMHEVVSSLSVLPGGKPAHISHAADPLPSKQLNPLEEHSTHGYCISKSIVLARN